MGSGPIRIGQGIEFDYSTVHGVQAARDAGYEAVVVNNNPETVSTDFDAYKILIEDEELDLKFRQKLFLLQKFFTIIFLYYPVH